MKNKKQYLVTGVLLCASLQLLAQNTAFTNTTVALTANKISPKLTEQIKISHRQQNFLKLNLTGLAFKNYSLQYERTAGKKISAAFAFKMMPGSGFPFKNQLSKTAGQTGITTIDMINNLQFSNYAFTPEVKIYLGKRGYGRGFYVAPFYRYAITSINNIQIPFKSETTQTKSFELAGKLKSTTMGMLFGAQWTFGKSICLDWAIAGPHYGFATGDFEGSSNPPLSKYEQSELYKEIHNIEIPMTEKRVDVTPNGAKVNVNGPWGGIRAGVSLGIKL